MHAPAPEKSRSARLMAAVAACIALSGNLSANQSANAADECPAPRSATGTERPAPIGKPGPELADTPIEYEADGMEATRDGNYLLKGDVLIKQGERTLKTSNARFDAKTQSFDVDDELEYADPDMKVSGTSAPVD